MKTSVLSYASRSQFPRLRVVGPAVVFLVGGLVSGWVFDVFHQAFLNPNPHDESLKILLVLTPIEAGMGTVLFALALWLRGRIGSPGEAKRIRVLLFGIVYGVIPAACFAVSDAGLPPGLDWLVFPVVFATPVAAAFLAVAPVSARGV